MRAAEREYAPFDVKIEIQRHAPERPQDQIEALRRSLRSDAPLDGLILSPMWIDESYPDLASISTTRNVPVITVNLDLPKAQRIAYVGPNYEQGGALAAEMIARCLGGRGTVGVISSVLHYQSNDLRLAGFLRRMGGYRDISVVGPISIVDIADNYTAASSLLSDHPDLSGLYTTTDTELLLPAVERAERSDVVVVGNDLTPNLKSAIADGRLAASIHQRPFLQGYLAGKTLLNYVLYGRKPRNVAIPVGFDVALQENLEFESDYEGYLDWRGSDE